VAGRDGGWQVKNWLAEVVAVKADKGTFIFWRPLTSLPPPHPSEPFTLCITPYICGILGGAQGGYINKPHEKERIERNERERFQKRERKP
jgi:hypothetical protein